MDLLKVIRESIDEYHKKLITEGASDILYHFTNMSHAINMLETNQISLTAAIGTAADLDVNKNKFFFFLLQEVKAQDIREGTLNLY